MPLIEGKGNHRILLNTRCRAIADWTLRLRVESLGSAGFHFRYFSSSGDLIFTRVTVTDRIAPMTLPLRNRFSKFGDNVDAVAPSVVVARKKNEPPLRGAIPAQYVATAQSA